MTVAIPKKKKEISCLLDLVKASLTAISRHHAGAEERPVAILWADADEQWRPVVEKLRAQKCPIITLGTFDLNNKTGPAIWLKCIIDKSIDVGFSNDDIPIVYLPGINRQMLRTAVECPFYLEPLVELQFRGVVWTQRNGKDWTVEAFLVSEDGLDLDVAKDEATRRSIYASLPVLAETPLSRLQGRRLEAEDFDRLMIGDQDRDILEWMSDPNAVRGQWGEGRWHAFCSRCKEDFKFNPDSDGVIIAVEQMGLKKEDVWKQLWARFSEAPAHYPGIENLLMKAKPRGELLFDLEPWPDENEKAEDNLRLAFQKLRDAHADEARRKIQELEKEHGHRRNWVWSRLGKTTLANALKYLSILAAKTESGLRGGSFDEYARNYSTRGSEIDTALLNAINEGKTSQDRSAICHAARSLYYPWLHDATEHFQKFVVTKQLPDVRNHKDYSVSNGDCILFVDGLRFDLGQRLQALLEERGVKVDLGHGWTGAPTVTSSAKPVSAPIVSKIGSSLAINETFTPTIAAVGQDVSTIRFRKLVEEVGLQVIAEDDVGSPEGKGWTEFGVIDRRGHDLGLDLARQIPEQLESIADRVMHLFESGWKAIRIVTDHGWLLMPGGLPKTELPGYLVQSRWSRCAVIKGESKVSVPTAPWFWNPDIHIATAPSISTFVANQEYAHGGISIQECLTPILMVRPVKDIKRITATILSVHWVGLRCRIKVAFSEPLSANVDIRTKANASATSLVDSMKIVDENGQVSLVIPDEDKMGTAVNVVVLDMDGNILAREMTTIGGN